jgi:hypothetical protein
MNKCIIVIFVFCATVMLMGCATIPKFKSVKEADCYVGTVPISERFKKFGIEAYAVKNPLNRKKQDGFGTALGVGAAVATGNVLLAMPMPASPFSDYKEIWGGVASNGMPVILYRETPGEPVWNVVAEALKRAGPPPKSDSCIYEGIRVSPMILNKSEYAGEDGKIVITDWLDIKLYFAKDRKADPPCDEKAWQVYVDYVQSVADNIKNIIEEEFALPNRTRFCTLERKDKP